MDRSTAASIAALTRVAREGGAAISAPARATRMAGYLSAVDPEGLLPVEERASRASALLRADMKRLAAKSADARRRTSATQFRQIAAEAAAAADELEAAT